MNAMASRTVFFGYGSMVLGVLFQQTRQIGELATLVIIQTIFPMAFQAKISGKPFKEILNRGCVRVVTVLAGITPYRRSVLESRFFLAFGDVKVTAGTESLWRFM
jgi:hypothetical protein